MSNFNNTKKRYSIKTIKSSYLLKRRLFKGERFGLTLSEVNKIMATEVKNTNMLLSSIFRTRKVRKNTVSELVNEHQLVEEIVMNYVASHTTKDK